MAAFALMNLYAHVFEWAARLVAPEWVERMKAEATE